MHLTGWVGLATKKSVSQGCRRKSTCTSRVTRSNVLSSRPGVLPLISATRSPAVELLVTLSHTIAPCLCRGMMGGLDVVKR
jgi:hypothetical protein